MSIKFFKFRKLRNISILVLVLLCLLETESKFTPKIRNGAVVSNAPGCAQIGMDILKRGGNIIDTIVATAFCEGVVNPTTMGLGGGFLATIYDRSTREVWSFNSRESAPAAATEQMFVKNHSLSERGGLSVAIPSEVRGYWTLYNKWGGDVPWSDLIQPTIKMCLEGIVMNDLTERNVNYFIDVVRADPGLTAIFIDPKTKAVYKKGQKYKRPKLAKTLKVIAEEGGNALYEGSLTKGLVKDIKDRGGIITEADMKNYKPIFERPIYTKINGKNIYSMPLPGSGVIMTYILNILDDYLDKKDEFSVKNYQRLVESLKYGYAMRSKLGDKYFEPGLEKLIKQLTSKKCAKETRRKISDYYTSSDPAYYGSELEPVQDHGTANIVVWGPNGDGISLTSSINYVLGAGFASPSTDIILNDSMDDFSTPGFTNEYGFPASPNNYIKPGKRPLSSMCPTIITDGRGDLFMVVGGAGGSRITSSVTQVIMNRIYFGRDIKSASDAKRVHHQLYPMNLLMEDEWLIEDEDVVLGLKEIGHNITFSKPDGFVAVTTVGLDEDKKDITGVYDKRRVGSVAYVNPINYA